LFGFGFVASMKSKSNFAKSISHPQKTSSSFTFEGDKFVNITMGLFRANHLIDQILNTKEFMIIQRKVASRHNFFLKEESRVWPNIMVVDLLILNKYVLW